MIEATGAFLTADMDKEVIVILENEIIDVMLEIEKDVYRKYFLHVKNGKKHMYVRLIKAKYGTPKAILLYYRKL